MILFLDLLSACGLAAYIVLGLAFPLLAIGQRLFSGGAHLLESDVLSAAKITLLQATISTFVAAFIGVAVALIVPRRSRWVRVALGAPFGVPAVVACAAWMLCLPKALSFSLTAVIIAHVFFNAPWIALWVSQALDEIRAEEREAAVTLGAGPFRIFRFVTFPKIAPTLAAAATQVFSFCAMSFVLVLILGGGPPVDTLETALFSKIRAGGLDVSGAASCAFWQLLLTVLPWWILMRKRPVPTLESRASRRYGKAAPARTWAGGALCLAFLLPYLILLGHFRAESFFSDPERLSEMALALRASALLAGATGVLAVFVALLGSWASLRNRFFARLGAVALILPSGISVMVLGLGFFLVYGKWLDPFSPSLWPIAVLQSIFFVPIAFRIFQPVAGRRARSAWDAALTLGASSSEAFFWVEWPRWKAPIAGTLSLIAGAALGEVAAVSLFYNEERIPAALLISRWMGKYRFEEAQGLALVLMVLSTVLIGLGFWLSHEVDHVAR